ncbi:MAG: LLM class F420-dependent oxidoreductase [Pseudomonadota bacterium]
MQLGVVFPQLDIGADPVAVRDYAQAAEALGYTHILAFDHVIGVNPESRPGWKGPYDHTAMFHEPFVLFGYLAGVTSALGFISGVLVLPQRQTQLVAKQAAEVDILCGGRLRLGVGVGWNAAEFEAMGARFDNRGRRIEEQITLMRRLWSEELVTFEGDNHGIRDAGINPLPRQRPIPIWIGGSAEAVIRRVGRMGDGWLPQFPSLDPVLSNTGAQPRRGESPEELIEKMRAYAREAGRNPSDIGIEGRASIANQTPDDWIAAHRRWKALEATHLSVNTMRAGLTGPDAHIDAIRRYKEAIDQA